jgi:hypothetical protein
MAPSLDEDYQHEIPLIQNGIKSIGSMSSQLKRLECQMNIIIDYCKKDKKLHVLADLLERCDESPPDLSTKRNY